MTQLVRSNIEIQTVDHLTILRTFASKFFLDNILSNSTVDMTGGTLNLNGDLGRASGKGILIGNKIKAAEDLEQLLWFELITTDLSGKENTYQLPLVLNKVA